MKKGAVGIENKNGRSTAEKAARGAQMLKGAVKTAGGIASGNFVTATQGAAEVLSPKAILITAGILLFFLLLPIMVIAAIPQMLFSWGSVNDAELIERNRRGSALVQQYNDELQACPPGVNPDIYRLISIESVRSRQNVQNISPLDIHNSILNSYTIDDSGYVHNKTPDEMMDSLNFSDNEKNWANLMYDTLNDQYLDPDGGFADKSPNYDGAMLGAEGETQVVYYSQLDSRWADKAYGKSGTIGGSGCGPTSLAAAFPFSSFEIYDPGGIFLGLNKYNSSVAILDIFDSNKYSNANGCILGMSGAGKTFLMQLMALRLRLQGTQVFILAPIKGHEFAAACRAEIYVAVGRGNHAD